MALEGIFPPPSSGELLGYDPVTDQLYFLADGVLQLHAAAEVEEPAQAPWIATEPPASSVRSLIVSPGWPEDPTLFGIWEVPQPEPDCWVMGQAHGLLLISHDGGSTWKRPASLDHACGYVSTLAVSPGHPDDGVLFAGLPGLGLWMSPDGGQTWRPSAAHLPSMGIQQILLSPAFNSDRTVFLRTISSGDLYRSSDGGKQWDPLHLQALRMVQMSPEFALDRTLMGMAWELSTGTTTPPNELLISADGGDHWEHAGELGAARTASLLSLAPLFAKWKVVFVRGDNGWLYRSENSGAHWVPVLHTGAAEGDPFHTSGHLVYATGSEEDRTLFLLATSRDQAASTPSVVGRLYRSDDGGQSWQELDLPPEVLPTALTMTPDHLETGVLFLGTADGRVVSWPAGVPTRLCKSCQ
jgi:photosystem II stability/assembly factor-like uncharacterized protein